MAMIRNILLGWALLGAGVGGFAQPTYQLTVPPEDFARPETVVSFTLPSGMERGSVLVDEQENVIPVQADRRGQGWFIARRLPAKESKGYLLAKIPGGAPATNTVEIQRDGDVLTASVYGIPVFKYQGGPGTLPRPEIKPAFRRGGYIHPIWSPLGKPITDDYPTNHLHHHGLWFAYAKTAFEQRHPDFWNMGEGTGTVEFVKIESVESGPVWGRLVTSHRYVDLSAPQPQVVLKEQWEVTLYALGVGKQRYWMFDLAVTQDCAGSKPLVLPQHIYGGLAWRGHEAWNGADQAGVLTAEGQTDRLQANGKAHRWCYLGGQLDGAAAGMSVLGHPDNFRAPQPVRVHEKEPYLSFTPSAAGDWAIQPGKPYVARYRLVVHDGPPNTAWLDQLWNEYAHPARGWTQARQ